MAQQLTATGITLLVLTIAAPQPPTPHLGHAMAVAFASLQSQILLRRPHLLKNKLSLEQRRRILARGVSGGCCRM